MKKGILLCLLLVISLLTKAQQMEYSTLYFEGEERVYILYLPSGYEDEQNLPVVFAFHDMTELAANIYGYSGLNEVAEEHKFIVCYPEGDLLFNLTHWNVGGFTQDSDVNDVGYVNAVVNKVIEDYNVDDTRFYACGRGNGGFFSLLSACQLSHKFAAVASAGGSMTFEMLGDCNPGRPVPVLQLHGTEDDWVYYDQIDTFYNSALDVIDYWVTHNECNTEPVIEAVENQSDTDNSTVEVFTYSGETECQKVVHYRVNGAGRYAWPGASGNFDFEFAEALWTFFSGYSLEDGTSCQPVSVAEVSGERAKALMLYPQPAQDKITVVRESAEPSTYCIMSLSGQIARQGHLTTTHQQIDLTTLSPGVYVLCSDGLRRRLIVH